MPGLAAPDANAEVFPPGHDPMRVAVEQLTNASELLRRLVEATENRIANRRDVIVELAPSNGNGLVVTTIRPQIRGTHLILAPYGSGRFAIRAGTQIIFRSQFAGSAVTTAIPWPKVWENGVQVELYDPTNVGTLQEYYAYIVGTTE